MRIVPSHLIKSSSETDLAKKKVPTLAALFIDNFEAAPCKSVPDTFFSVDSKAVMQRIQATKDYYACAYPQETKKIVENETFQKNPVAFLYKWREEHPKAQLLFHDWMNSPKVAGSRELDGSHSNQGPQSPEEYAIAGIARQVMADPDYIPNFLAWTKSHAGQIVKEQFSKTTQPEVLKCLTQGLVAQVTSEEFLTNLKALKQGILGQAQDEARKNLGELLFIDCGTLFDDSDKMLGIDLIKDSVSRSVKDIVRNYFDLAGKRPSMAALFD